jgi:hypothetical protein
MEITTVGLDLAKNVFQVHAISSTGEVVVRRALLAEFGVDIPKGITHAWRSPGAR